MAKIDPLKLWTLNYRLITGVIEAVVPPIEQLGVEIKELFVLAEIDEHPHPAELAVRLSMPKPSITVYLKRLEAAGLVRREIDPGDLRKHKIQLTAAGRKVTARGLALLSEGFGVRLGRLSQAEQAELKALFEKMM